MGWRLGRRLRWKAEGRWKIVVLVAVVVALVMVMFDLVDSGAQGHRPPL
jgi:hypothetical protein